MNELKVESGLKREFLMLLRLFEVGNFSVVGLIYNRGVFCQFKEENYENYEGVIEGKLSGFGGF